MEDFDPIAGYPNKRTMLEALYVQEELSISQVSRRIGVSTASVERWLQLLGIPRRGRGGDHGTAKVGWRLHRLDPRVVFCLPIREVARMVQVSQSYVYKFIKAERMIWNSASLVPPQG
jgi:transposase